MTEASAAPEPEVPEVPELPAAASPAAPVSERKPTLGRVVEWFWRGQSIRLAASKPSPGDSVTALQRRALIAARRASKIAAPNPPFASGSPHALACDLYAESIRCSLEALRAQGVPEDQLQAMLVSGGESDAELLSKSFVDNAELDAAAQRRSAARLERTARRLQRAIVTPQTEIAGLRAQRFIRTAALISLVVAVVIASVASSAWLGDRGDLALGRPWTTSSQLGSFGCQSPAQVCQGSEHFFFHTLEEQDPWIEIDLGSARSISRVKVENRRDCCFDRALPLVIEVAGKKGSWREVARRSESFSTWEANFKPTRARWLRLRVAGRSSLHLARVRALS